MTLRRGASWELVRASPWRLDREGVVPRTRPRGRIGPDPGRARRHEGCSWEGMDSHRARALLVALTLATGCAPTAAVAPPSAAGETPEVVAPISSAVPAVEADAGAPRDAGAIEGDAGPVEDGRVPSAPETPPAFDATLGDEPALVPGEEGRLSVRGLPALSADGRRVLLLSEQEEGPADLELADTATGRTIRSWPYPQEWREVGDELVPHTDVRARRRTERLFRAQGFRSLAPLAVLSRDDESDARTTVFAAGDVRVTATTSIDDVDGSHLDVSVDVGSAHFEIDEDGADHLSSVEIAPDRSFLVLDYSFCACECAWWSRVVPIERAPIE